MTRRTIAELFDLSGKTAIVTGAGQGMGKSIAMRLADAGANVAVSARKLDSAEHTVAEIRADGGRAIAAPADITISEQLDDVVAAACDAFGGIDILVNCAGGSHPYHMFIDVPAEALQATLERNLHGAYLLSQRAARRMIEDQRQGRIVNIASTAAFRPDFLVSAYNASKAALVSLAQSICVDLAPHGITVNTVAPGPIKTPGTDWAYADPVLAEKIKSRIPLGSPGEADDIAAAVLFAVSPAARFMTGATIVIDGGYMWA